jgi:hypothetical protein
MVYENEIHQMLRNFTSQYGKLKEVTLAGGSINLKFEKGSVSNPKLMKYGYIGTGPQCLYTFMCAAGFTVSLDELQEKISETKTFRLV